MDQQSGARWPAHPCPKTRELEDLAVRSARAVGAIYCGVDLLESKDGLTTIEVNGTPQAKGSMMPWE